MLRLGIINDIWTIGADHVVRIPTEPEYSSSMLSESVAIPCAHSAGVLTPNLVVFDNDRDIVHVPFAITKRACGIPIGATRRLSCSESAVFHWSDTLSHVGQQLASLHQTVEACSDPNGWLNPWWLDNPLEQLGECVERGTVTTEEAQWVERFAKRIGQAFTYDQSGPCDKHTFVHHDLHPWNIMVMVGEKDTPRLTSVLDWGNACWGDPAVDFSGFPLWSLPTMVDAYQSAGGHRDTTFEGRVLWMWLALALGEPHFLDPGVFNRFWWRLPEDGIKELQYRLFLLPDPWRQWAV